MKVIRSERAGFCMGVALALNKLDKLVEKGGHVGTFGPIIHNPFVLEEYAQKGVRCFGSVQAVKEALEPFYVFSETINATDSACTSFSFLGDLLVTIFLFGSCKRQ